MVGSGDPKNIAAPAQESLVPISYINGFELGSSFSDVRLSLMVEGVPFNRLYMSFTTAKSLAANLNELISQFEKATDYNLLTMDDVSAKMIAAGLVK